MYMQHNAQMYINLMIFFTNPYTSCNPNPIQNLEQYNHARESPHAPTEAVTTYLSDKTTVLIILPHRLNLPVLKLHINEIIQSIMLLSLSIFFKINSCCLYQWFISFHCWVLSFFPLSCWWIPGLFKIFFFLILWIKLPWTFLFKLYVCV